jgi:hypothetical protein
VEANTSHSSASGLFRGRLSGLSLGGSRNGQRSASRKKSEPTARLDHYLSDSSARVLHHRRVDGEPVEIDHVIVGPAGITVVDSRHYDEGRARVERGVLRVGRRKRLDQVEEVLAQVRVVRELLADTSYVDVDVEAALAYRDVHGLPTLHGFNAPRIMICGTRRIAREASRPGPLSKRRVGALVAYLERSMSNAR